MSNLAETILRDVPIRGRIYTGGRINTGGNCLDELVLKKDVEAALTAAMDPAIAERAERLARSDDPKVMLYHGEYVEALRALLAQNAALRAERDRYLRHLTAGAESLNAYKARVEAAEAQIAALTARVEGLTGAVKGLVEILDQHETKGPLPDVALMFCWLAAQEVRAVMRKDGGQ